MKATINVSMKHNDLADLSLVFENGSRVNMYGYLPRLGPFNSDYTKLVIDNETGKIVNWVPFTMKFLEDEANNI